MRKNSKKFGPKGPLAPRSGKVMARPRVDVPDLSDPAVYAKLKEQAQADLALDRHLARLRGFRFAGSARRAF